MTLLDGRESTFDGRRWRGGPARAALEALAAADPGSVPSEFLPHRGRVPGRSALSTAERREDVSALSGAGATYELLCDRMDGRPYAALGESTRRVYPGVRPVARPTTYGSLAELGRGGMSWDRIAEVLDVNRSTVARDIRRSR